MVPRSGHKLVSCIASKGGSNIAILPEGSRYNRKGERESELGVVFSDITHQVNLLTRETLTCAVGTTTGTRF